MGRSIQTRQLGLSQPSLFILLTMNYNPNARNIIVGYVIGIWLLMFIFIPITVHGQDGSMALPPPLFEHKPFDFGTDQSLRELTPEPSFNWRLKIIGEDFVEFFTFNPLEKAQLKLEFAEQRQMEIDFLDSRGLAIPLEYEERRIQKLNEAREIVNERIAVTPVVQNELLRRVIDSFETLKQMGELNDIRVLYSQLPSVINAPDAVKERYNEKVNALDTWQEFCIGEFDVDNLRSLRTAVDDIEQQCPKLVELQEQFGR